MSQIVVSCSTYLAASGEIERLEVTGGVLQQVTGKLEDLEQL